MRDVWHLQSRFSNRSGTRAYRLLGHPKFRAAYDFMLLRAETGGAEPELATWWADFQVASEVEQKKLLASLTKTAPRKRRRRRKPAVKINKMTKEIAYIGLGSNLATPEAQINTARNAITALPEVFEDAFPVYIAALLCSHKISRIILMP